MSIAIDVRALTDVTPTGVAMYTVSFIEKSLEADNDVILWYSGTKRIDWIHTKWESRATIFHINIPNKLLNLSLLLFRYPKLDTYLAKKTGKQITEMIAPNMNTYALSADVTFTLTVHDLAFYIFPYFYSWRRRLWHRLVNISQLSACANTVLVPSQSTAWDVEEWLHVEKNKIIIGTPAIAEQFSDSDNWSLARQQEVRSDYALPAPFLLYVGTIEPRKNLETLLAAFAEIKKTRTDAELVVAGPVGWKSRRLVKQLTNTPGVMYLGYVDAADKPALYAAATAFVYPSLYEGYGFPVLEAQAVGTQVITSDRSSLLEVAGPNALIIDPHSVTDLADAMKSCL